MAAVTVNRSIELGGTDKLYVGTIAFDSSYPTGGEALDATANEQLDYVFCTHQGGYSFAWDAANQKLLAYYCDYDAGADGPLIQVPNTTDLSALTAVPFIGVGQ